jgi:PLP dependent protein
MGDDATTARVRRVLAEVREAAERAGRDPSAVTLVGVCKTVGRDEVQRAYEAGVRHFGENRVQDAAAKFSNPLPPDAALHMIGQLQTNKANLAAKLFDAIESVDRPSLIAELEKQGAKSGKRIAVLLQVNVAGEPSPARSRDARTSTCAG